MKMETSIIVQMVVKHSLTKKEFNEKYPSPEVEWWTYEEYKEWLDNERIQLQSMLGEKHGLVVEVNLSGRRK